MELYVNNKSGKIYSLIHREPTGAPIGLLQALGQTANTLVICYLERMFDGRNYQLEETKFKAEYTLLTAEQFEKFKRIAPAKSASRVQVTIEDIERVNLDDPKQAADADGTSQDEGGVGKLITPSDLDNMDRLIVSDKVKESVHAAIELIVNRDDIDEKWGISELTPLKGRCIVNMYGPPGTGKTMSAKCIAKYLDKKLYQVDYAEVISKYVGDTGKNIRAAFEAAKKHDAILFFDEADSLLSKRVEMAKDGESNSINQNRNILMQELDKYDGIMLTSTNFFKNYDEAVLRRIQRHIQFDLPTEEMRTKIIIQQLPKKTKARLEDDVSFTELSKKMVDFSGGDIVNVCNNAILRAAVQKADKLSQEHLTVEIEEINKNKKEHGYKRSGLNRVGF